MAFRPVPVKLHDLMDLFMGRAAALVKEDEPDMAYFWASAVNGLFQLAFWMNEDGQISPDLFSKVGKIEAQARRITRRLGPSLSGSKRDFSARMAELYGRFLQDLDSGRWAEGI